MRIEKSSLVFHKFSTRCQTHLLFLPCTRGNEPKDSSKDYVTFIHLYDDGLVHTCRG